ncbi:hypothetical protein B0H13DRAFT_1851234 [Mycena leptocephala]|nr:hypothetical protein B0H13DRAFT_1851234 [Mycena leptocephala]
MVHSNRLPWDTHTECQNGRNALSGECAVAVGSSAERQSDRLFRNTRTDCFQAVDPTVDTVHNSPSPVPAHSIFFREEYVLPYDSQILELMTQRRTSDKSSSTSSSPSPEHVAGRTRAGLKRNKSRLQLAGLVGGDSDSSALTQDSGDESMVLPTPRYGVSTVPAGGADYSGDDDAEMRGPFPHPGLNSPTRKSTSIGKRTAATAASASAAGSKQKKEKTSYIV